MKCFQWLPGRDTYAGVVGYFKGNGKPVAWIFFFFCVCLLALYSLLEQKYFTSDEWGNPRLPLWMLAHLLHTLSSEALD